MNEKQSQLLLGWVIPAALLLWAFYCASDGEVVFRGRGGSPLVLTGVDVVLYFAAAVGVAAMAHAHLFWGNFLWNVGYAQLGEIGGLVLFTGAVVAIVARQFLNFA